MRLFIHDEVAVRRQPKLTYDLVRVRITPIENQNDAEPEE
jgi:hypothetical protein